MMTEPDDLKLKSKTLAQLEDLYQAMQGLGYPGIAKEVATEIALRRRQNPLQSGRQSHHQDEPGKDTYP